MFLLAYNLSQLFGYSLHQDVLPQRVYPSLFFAVIPVYQDRFNSSQTLSEGARRTPKLRCTLHHYLNPEITSPARLTCASHSLHDHRARGAGARTSLGDNMSLDGWNPRTQPLKPTLSHKPATLRLPSSPSNITYKPLKVEKMVRAKEVKARVQQKKDQKKEATTSAPTPPPAPPKKTTTAAKQPKVNRDYEFNDGDDQMWHATWCLDSWNKPGSKTLLLFQWDCQDEPTWEPFEGHSEDSCLAADFFVSRPSRSSIQTYS